MRDLKTILLMAAVAYLAVAFTPTVLLREALKAGIYLPVKALVV